MANPNSRQFSNRIRNEDVYLVWHDMTSSQEEAASAGPDSDFIHYPYSNIHLTADPAKGESTIVCVEVSFKNDCSSSLRP